MPNPPETLTAQIEALLVNYDALDEDELRPMLDRDDVLSLAAQHDAEMARLRQERDRAKAERVEIAMLASVGLNTNATAWEALRQIAKLTAPPTGDA